MAWTAPRNWSDISQNIVTAAMLNTDVRDNLLFLGGTSVVTSGHTHTGAAGMGAASMSGLTLTALVNLTFADEGAPNAAGELQRHGNDLKWYGGSLVNLTAADQSAGTASLRSLGTGSTQAAVGSHSHEPATPNVQKDNQNYSLSDNNENTVVSFTFTPQAANLQIVMVGITLIPFVGGSQQFTIRLKYDDEILDSTDPIPESGGGNLDSILEGIKETDENSHTYSLTAQRTSGSIACVVHGALVVREVSV